MKAEIESRCVEIDYTNHRGERSKRVIYPLGLKFGRDEWHPGLQYLLQAWDVGKKAERTFAMRDIHSWEPHPSGTTYEWWADHQAWLAARDLPATKEK